MPYKDTEVRKQYHRDYYREYMRTKGRIYVEHSEAARNSKMAEWKEDLMLDYKLRRIQKKYGREGLIAFEKAGYRCILCHESDFRVLEVHEVCKPFISASNLRILCANCHTKITIFEDSEQLSPEHWDSHFMRVAEYYGREANCFSRKLGAIVVKYDEFNIPSIVSLGRNGPPIGYPHCNTRNPNNEDVCPRRLMGFASGEGLEHCPASHAEANAIIFAARDGIAIDGCTLYTNSPIPCRCCTTSIIQSGIKEVVVSDLSDYQSGEGIKSINLFNQSGVKIRQIDEEKISDIAFGRKY